MKEEISINLSPDAKKAILFIGRKLLVYIGKTHVTDLEMGYRVCLRSLGIKIKAEPAINAEKIRIICNRREAEIREIINEKRNNKNLRRKEEVSPWQQGTLQALSDMLEHLA